MDSSFIPSRGAGIRGKKYVLDCCHISSDFLVGTVRLEEAATEVLYLELGSRYRLKVLLTDKSLPSAFGGVKVKKCCHTSIGSLDLSFKIDVVSVSKLQSTNLRAFPDVCGAFLTSCVDGILRVAVVDGGSLGTAARMPCRIDGN